MIKIEPNYKNSLKLFEFTKRKDFSEIVYTLNYLLFHCIFDLNNSGVASFIDTVRQMQIKHLFNRIP